MARLDPRLDAERYLTEHNIQKLFRDLGMRLLYERPADPNAFLVKVLQDMKTGRKQPFFNEQDVRACFSAFDVTNTGEISADQYTQGLKILGIDDAPGLEAPTIDRESFVAKVMAGIAQSGI